MQSVPGYYLGQRVPTNGAMGQYTIIANADVFGSEAVTYQVESLDLLKIGQFFDRVNPGTEQVYSTATNSSESGGQRLTQAAGETANITLTALGYDQVRRDLARKLRVNPYNSNPILTEKLNHVAWIMFSARMMVNTAISVPVPGSMIITGLMFTTI
ncbi:MAG: hypothetical protein JO189_30920 [Deltaproteobacteria bacterium]|nr:hypothetical protein [Deltaproteobacteria bacterium]